MSISSLDPKYFSVTDSCYTVKCPAIGDKETAGIIANKCENDAKKERSNANLKMGMCIASAFAAGALSLIAYKVGTLAVAILTFPLMIIPPLHALVTMLGGLAAGGATFGIIMKKTRGFNEAKAHRRNAEHYDVQAFNLRLHMQKLPSTALPA